MERICGRNWSRQRMLIRFVLLLTAGCIGCSLVLGQEASGSPLTAITPSAATATASLSELLVAGGSRPPDAVGIAVWFGAPFSEATVRTLNGFSSSLRHSHDQAAIIDIVPFDEEAAEVVHRAANSVHSNCVIFERRPSSLQDKQVDAVVLLGFGDSELDALVSESASVGKDIYVLSATGSWAPNENTALTIRQNNRVAWIGKVDGADLADFLHSVLTRAVPTPVAAPVPVPVAAPVPASTTGSQDQSEMGPNKTEATAPQTQASDTSEALPDIRPTLEEARTRRVELSRDETKVVGKELVQTIDRCNSNGHSFHVSTTVWCIQASAAIDSRFGKTDPRYELTLLRACAMRDDRADDSTRELHELPHYCAQLAQFYAQNNEPLKGLAVLAQAQGCTYRTGNDEEDGPVCKVEAARIAKQIGDTKRELGTVSELCYQYHAAEYCSRMTALGGGKADMAEVATQHAQGLASMREANEWEAQERADEHRQSEENWNNAVATLQDQKSTVILDTANQQAAQMVAIGAANDAARQQASQARISAQQTVPQPTGVPQSGASLPPPAMAPLTVSFTSSQAGYQGHAHVVSTPPGIDCPSTCSFQFGQNVPVMLTATADSGSAVHSLSCQMGAGTAPLVAGNNMSCSIPQWAFEGGQVRVFVDPYPEPGAASGASGNSQGSQTGQNGAGSGSGSGIGQSNNGGCTDATKYIGYTVKATSDGEVIGSLTNNSNQTLYVAFTFAKNGQPSKDMGVGGAVTLNPGQTISGTPIIAFGMDTNPPRIYWNAVLQSDIDQGKNCPSAW